MASGVDVERGLSSSTKFSAEKMSSLTWKKPKHLKHVWFCLLPFFPPLNSAVKKVKAREEQNQKMESYNSTRQRVDTWKSL